MFPHQHEDIFAPHVATLYHSNYFVADHLLNTPSIQKSLGTVKKPIKAGKDFHNHLT